jgi:hypothetical protein
MASPDPSVDDADDGRVVVWTRDSLGQPFDVLQLGELARRETRCRDRIDQADLVELGDAVRECSGATESDQ